MSHHLILALEAFPAETTRAPINRTEMWPVLRVNIGMGTGDFDVRSVSFRPLGGGSSLEEVLRLERCRCATRMCALVATRHCEPIGWLWCSIKCSSLTSWGSWGNLLSRCWVARCWTLRCHRRHIVWSRRMVWGLRRL